MPFWKRGDNGKSKSIDSSGDSGSGDVKSKEKINYKARLEHKQYLAQETPEPIYDISDCGLKTVPGGVYSRCKILLKEALLLQGNELTCLNGGGCLTDLSTCLQVLDLHKNHLEKLPNEIGMLKQLRVLHIHYNRLKKLPDSIGDLKALITLNTSHNSLKELPTTLSNLKRLKTLDISHNPKLKNLPQTLANCHSLETLVVLPGTQLQYPSTSVCEEGGTEAVMKFLCKECDIEYINPSAYNPPELSPASNGYKIQNCLEDPYERLVKGSLKALEKQKEGKLREMRTLEKAQEEAQEKEAILAANTLNSKKKLLDDIAKEGAKLDAAVKNLQKMKDTEKSELLSSLHNVENRTDSLINELMVANNARKKDPQELLKEMELERREMEEQFTIRADEAEKLREQDVLRAMQSVMAEELRREQLRREYEMGKKGVVDSALSMDSENDKAIEKVLASNGQHQKELISGLLESEKYQREAFTTMFMKQDERSKQLTEQVEQIQQELASLSMVEMTKKGLQVDFERELMAEKRETLTKILMEVMDQKKEREAELTKRLKEMDKSKSEEQENYWLIQYQKLLDSKPKGLINAEENVEPRLIKLLKKAGAEEYIPVFATRNLTMKQLSYMKDKELAELGMHNTYLRQKVLACVEEEDIAMKDKFGGLETYGRPSAPPQEDIPSAPHSNGAPSAPPIETFQSRECCVCMERKCNIIFLPCGHVCCCWNCENGLTSCPLCRAAISQKVRLC